jgi:small-conductance mechanosensitive channel
MEVNDLQMENARSKIRGVQGIVVLLVILIIGSGLSFLNVSKSDVAFGSIGMAILIIGEINALIAYAFVLVASKKLKGYALKEMEDKYFLRNVNWSLGSTLNMISMTGLFFGLIFIADGFANTKGIMSNELIDIVMGILVFVIPLYLVVAIPKCIRKYVFRRYRKLSNQ